MKLTAARKISIAVLVFFALALAGVLPGPSGTITDRSTHQNVHTGDWIYRFYLVDNGAVGWVDVDQADYHTYDLGQEYP